MVVGKKVAYGLTWTSVSRALEGSGGVVSWGLAGQGGGGAQHHTHATRSIVMLGDRARRPYQSDDGDDDEVEQE